MKKKVFVIGIDSATFDVIDPMIKNGQLPHLHALIRDGVSGALQSTVPPVTPPAWTSFMTGKNPGNHGVFDFHAPPSYGYNRPVLNAGYVKARTIWNIISGHGGKVGVINVPMTHPPEEVNGFIIPGMQYGLDTTSGFSFPDALMNELSREVGTYKVLFGDLVSLYSDHYDDLLREWREIVKIREKAITYLMETKEWDFFMAVFYSADVMQHHFWKYYDETHPHHVRSDYRDIIPEFYRHIDSSVGEILKRLDDDTVVCVVSDHGAGAEQKAFYVNTWLAEKGLLSFKKKYVPLWKYGLPHFAYKILRRAGVKAIEWTVPIPLLPLLGKAIDPREGLRVHELIDWDKTKAFAGNHTEQGIYINLKGREPSGIVNDGSEYEETRNFIMQGLDSVRNPETGRKMFDRILKKEDVYRGPYVRFAPDILVEMDGGNCLMQKEIYHRTLFRDADKSSGTHRKQGIFIMKGNNVKKGVKVSGLDITDAAPTILYAMGLPVPDDMDGKVQTQVFTDVWHLDNPVRFEAGNNLADKGGTGVYEEDESEKMKKMLRDLGYMG